MALIIDKNGNMSLVQGDSGDLVITGVPTDKNYRVFFAIQDSERKPIGEEIFMDSNRLDTVVINITGDLTDLLDVKKDDDTAEYLYGVKICDSETGYEDTMILGDGNLGDVNTITVYPRKVKGI